MTAGSRHSNDNEKLGKAGAPGAIRTPDPQIRSLNPLSNITYKIQCLSLKHCWKSFDVIGCFARVLNIVCHNLAKVLKWYYRLLRSSAWGESDD